MTKPTITEITMWDRHNYVNFSDTDSQYDYFNGYCLGVRQTIEWIRKDGGDRILVRFGNGVDRGSYRKRVSTICGRCGYVLREERKDAETPDGERWEDFWFVLTKDANRPSPV